MVMLLHRWLDTVAGFELEELSLVLTNVSFPAWPITALEPIWSVCVGAWRGIRSTPNANPHWLSDSHGQRDVLMKACVLGLQKRQ